MGDLLCDIWFPGKPRGKGRANFVPRPRGANMGVTISGVKYYPLKNIGCFPRPAATKGYEDDLRIAIIQQMRKQGHFTAYDGPVKLNWCAYYTANMSDNKKIKAQKMAGFTARLMKPDLDNIEKMICDAANTYVFLDDKQVIDARGVKVFSDKEGIRMRFYKADALETKAWVDEEFTWDTEDFQLV